MHLRAPHSRYLALLLAALWLVPPMVMPAHAKTAEPPAHEIGHAINIADNTIRLAKRAPAAPQTYGSFRRFGIYDAPPLTFSTPFNQVGIHYERTTPAGSVARVDVRGLSVHNRWSEWQTDVAQSKTAHFNDPMRAVQYRVILLGNGSLSPTVRGVSLVPQGGGVTTRAKATGTVAPTYRLRATRQGMVGGRTANGHIIKPNDFFVALPSDRALSSRGGDEYMVRLSANGRSVVVPVWDRGPWNHHDDYWNKDRERYKDLPVGWPQDHAAFYEKHNKGIAERGKVRFPSAIDIADGAYWALGLDGAQATVNVTFLWLGDDPGAAAKPLNSKPSERPRAIVPDAQMVDGTPAQLPATPAAPAPAPPAPPPPAPPPPPPPPPPTEPIIEVNDGDTAFAQEGSNWSLAVDTCAYGGLARSIRTVGREDSVSHQALWRPTLQGGTYDVYAFVPACAARSTQTTFARYIVHHAHGDSFVDRNQAEAAGTWISLGRFTFAAGSDGYIQLRNLGTGDETSIWFDAMKWVPVRP